MWKIEKSREKEKKITCSLIMSLKSCLNEEVKGPSSRPQSHTGHNHCCAQDHIYPLVLTQTLPAHQQNILRWTTIIESNCFRGFQLSTIRNHSFTRVFSALSIWSYILVKSVLTWFTPFIYCHRWKVASICALEMLWPRAPPSTGQGCTTQRVLPRLLALAGPTEPLSRHLVLHINPSLQVSPIVLRIRILCYQSFFYLPIPARDCELMRTPTGSRSRYGTGTDKQYVEAVKPGTEQNQRGCWNPEVETENYSPFSSTDNSESQPLKRYE